MSSAYTVVRRRVLYELGVGGVIPATDISAYAAQTATSVRWAQNTNLAADYFQINNTGLFRLGAATAADSYRPAGTLVNTTGVINQVGAAWADTTVAAGDDLEYAHGGVRLDVEWLNAINRVTIHDYITTYLALSHLGGLDGDMALSTDSNWTDVGTLTTSAKATTAGVTPWGQRSYHTVNNAVADSGTRSASYRVGTSRYMSGFTIAASEVGTSSLQPWDNTGSAVFSTISAVTSGEREPQLLAVVGQVPPTCKLMSLNLTNTSATGDTYWNQAWLYNWDDLYCTLPALLTESFHAPRILQGMPRYSTANAAYPAGSLEWVPLTEGVDYWFVIAPQDAVPYKVRFANSSYYNWPLIIEARIPQSALLTVSAEADLLHEVERIVPRFKKDLLETVYNVAPRRHPDWVVQHNLATEQLSKASNSRKMDSVAPPFVWAPRLNAS